MDGWALILGSNAVSAAVTAIGTLLVSRKTTEREADAKVLTAISDTFTSFSARYEASNKALFERVQSLEGAVIQLTGHVETLEGVLRANGLPVPARVLPFPVQAAGA